MIMIGLSQPVASVPPGRCTAARWMIVWRGERGFLARAGFDPVAGWGAALPAPLPGAGGVTESGAGVFRAPA